MPDPFVVGPTGLPLYRFADWRARVVELWKTAYGDDADTRSETPDGLVIDTLATLATLLGDATQSVYANSFFRTADQVGLAFLVDMFGRRPLGALPSTASAMWYGTATTEVHDGVGTGPVASITSTGDSNGDRYAVDNGSSGTIPALTDDGAAFVVTIITATDTNIYGIQVAATESTVTAGASDTVQDIAEGLAADLLSDNPTFTISTPGLDPSGSALIVVEGKGTEAVIEGPSTTDGAEIDLFPGVRLDMSNEVTGPKVGLAGTLNVIETPAAGLTGVTTTEDADLGRDLETPAELRIRHIDQINVGGRATPERIRTALLELDLTDVRVFENTSPITDSRGLPPHSFEPVVIGDATDAEVAQVVHEQKPAGILAHGDIETIVIDETGNPQTVGHSRGTEIYLHLDVVLTAGEGFPTTGDPAETVKAAIVADLETRLTIGQDLYLFALGEPINAAVPGVQSAAITADATPNPGDSPTLVASDVVVDEDEILRSDSSRITVSVAP